MLRLNALLLRATGLMPLVSFAVMLIRGPGLMTVPMTFPGPVMLRAAMR